MKKVTVALALMMSVGLTGCANTDVFSGDVTLQIKQKKLVQLVMVQSYLFVLLKSKLITMVSLVQLVVVL